MHPPGAPWSVTYHDGSGNGLRFWQEDECGPARVAYTPVTPARSSSGIYSGGAPRQAELGPREVEALWRHLLALEAEGAPGGGGRAMGSGAFRLRTASGSRRFVVSGGSRLRAWDRLVACHRG